MTGLALLALGAVVGALVFSFVIGRRRTRQLARLADRLAQSVGSPQVGRVHVADPVLEDALERLMARISDVEALASTDQLTRLLNRPACLGMLAIEIERANRYERPLTVALIDLDRFKRINDTFGHAVGDDVLRHVSDVLRANVRNVDALGRYGGEEFLLVMPETDLDGGIASAESLRRVVGRTPLTIDTPGGPTEIKVTISVGIAGHFGSRSLDIDGLLREADGALYEAKERGRDQVQAHRAFSELGGLTRATIDARARNEAAKIGQAAFEASSLHLLGALSERAGWAGGASHLIADLSAELGRAVGLPDGDIERIRTASLLHDLGKLAIPDAILSKPGPLTPPEWRTIVEHPKIGQVVLEQAGAIRDAAAIVLHHHEWFDGRGYPHGLAGAEIPIGSRIVAIADAYEAMISDRPYSAAMSHSDALGELERQRGVQFDPDLVDLFLSLVGDGTGALLAGRLSVVAVPSSRTRRASASAAKTGPRAKAQGSARKSNGASTTNEVKVARSASSAAHAKAANGASTGNRVKVAQGASTSARAKAANGASSSNGAEPSMRATAPNGARSANGAAAPTHATASNGAPVPANSPRKRSEARSAPAR